MNAWEKLNITQDIVDHCNGLSETSPNKNSRSYYSKCRDFLYSIKYSSYENLTYRQRNWARSIKRDLRDEGLI